MARSTRLVMLIKNIYIYIYNGVGNFSFSALTEIIIYKNNM